MFERDVEDISGEIVCVCDGGIAAVLGCDRPPAVLLLKHTYKSAFAARTGGCTIDAMESGWGCFGEEGGMVSVDGRGVKRAVEEGGTDV